MRSQLRLAMLFLAVAAQAFAQSGPAANLGVWQVNAGGAFTGIEVTKGNPVMEGFTGWSDVYPNLGPRFLRGFGMEAKGYEVGINHPTVGVIGVIINREKAYGGGVIYSWHHFSKFQPYGKYLMEFGTIDFNSFSPNYTSDTRTLYVPGGGIDCQLLPRIWVRADYEHQVWLNLFATSGLYEQVVTLGASYEFRHIHVP